MHDPLIGPIQALDACRGFLAACETVPRVFPSKPIRNDEFDALDSTFALLCEELELRPFELRARRPSDVNSLDLALSRYLLNNPKITLPDPANVHVSIEQWRQTMNSPAIETVTAKSGGRLRVEVWASPEQVQDTSGILVVPTCGVPMPAWRPLLRALAQSHPTLCWESPLLFGEEPLPTGDIVMALAEEIVDVVRACKLNEVHLVAICVGAAPALAAAKLLGAQLKSLTICHANLKVSDQELVTTFEGQYNTMLQDVCESEERARNIHSTLLEPGFAMSLPAELAPFILYPNTCLPYLRRHALVHSALTQFDARPLAGHINCPALILTTSTDRIVHPEQSRRLATLLPNADLYEFENGNHLDVFMDGNAFLPRILSFISQHTQTPGADRNNFFN